MTHHIVDFVMTVNGKEIRLGWAKQTERGWTFHTAMPGRKGSIKIYDTLGKCVPSWVKSHKPLQIDRNS